MYGAIYWRVRDLINLVNNRVCIDIGNGDVFVIVGSMWFVATKRSLDAGIFGNLHRMIGVEVSKDESPWKIAALLGKRRGKVSGSGLYLTLPGPFSLRLQSAVVGKNEPTTEKAYGFVYNEETEGLYWGDWFSEIGDASAKSVLWRIKDKGRGQEV